jgi:methionyl-tRNA formyltransferase
LRTVYLGTSPFAAAVLERLAATSHRPQLVVTRPDRPRGRGRALQSPPVAETARALGIDVIGPEALHAPEVLERVAAAAPEVLVVCAFGVLVREPLLSQYEIFNVHPSLLPRWRGAAPVERAIMAGDTETGVSIMRLTAGLDSGPVCLRGAEPILPGDDYGTLSARLEDLGGRLLVRALDERPPWEEQPEHGVTYAHKIEAADRTLDHTRTPEEVERTVRGLRPHIGARLPLPDGRFLGVHGARVPSPPVPTLAPAGGRVRTDGLRLYLDCRGGALELTEIQAPGGRVMPAEAWLRGRPDPALTDFWLDPRLPGRPTPELVRQAVAEWGSAEEWAPSIAALGWRGSAEVLEALAPLVTDPDPAARSVAAYVAGELGGPVPAMPEASARLLEDMGEREGDPHVLAVIAEALGRLGDPWGLSWLLRMRRHPDAGVRDGVASALAGRTNPLAVGALMELSADPDAAIRDWATFGLGTLADHDSPELRAALAARLDDRDPDARIGAVHGLALRGDVRAVEPALALLEAGDAGRSRWSRHALEEAAILLAALSGDRRFAPYLPSPDGWRGTTLERALQQALERTSG